MARVLATGVFNILHPGHLLFLEEAKSLGDELVVIVSSDKIASMVKTGLLLPQDQRVKMVGALKMVDMVLVGDDEDTMDLLPAIRPDIIALGYDQDVDEEWLEDKLKKMGLSAKIVRIDKHLEGDFTSTTKIVKGIQD